MILKRQEKDGIVKAIYDSTNVLASIYENEDLTIIFKAGTKYKYSKVSKTDYTRFELAESQGAVFATHIKKYPFTQLDKIDPKEILAEIHSIKTGADKAMLDFKRKKIFESIGMVLQFEGGPITEEASAKGKNEIINGHLTNLRNFIDDYFTLLYK